MDDECYGKDEYRSKQTNGITFTWRLAKVIKVQDDSVKLHFDGWHSRWDEWFELNGKRLMTVEEANHCQLVVMHRSSTQVAAAASTRGSRPVAVSSCESKSPAENAAN